MTILFYLGGEGCGLQVVKAQQRVQQEGGGNLTYDVFLEQVTILVWFNNIGFFGHIGE